MAAKGRSEHVPGQDPELAEIISILATNEVLPNAFQALECYLATHSVCEQTFRFVTNGISPFFDRLCIQSQDHIPECFKLQFQLRDIFCSVMPEPVYILKIVLALLKKSCPPYDVFIECFGEELVPGLISLLRLQNERTKMLVFAILQIIEAQYKQAHHMLLEAISNEFTVLFISTPSGLPEDSKIDAGNIEWTIRLLFLLIDSEEFSSQVDSYYLQFILPAISIHPSSFSLLVLVFCREFSCCRLYTMRHLCKVYDAAGPTALQTWIIDTMGKVLEIHAVSKGADDLEPYVSSLLGKALESESFIIIDAVLNFLGQEGVQRFLEDRIPMILPKCFGHLYRLSKRFWRREQRMKALEVVQSLVNLNHDLVEACLVKYNSQKLGERTQETSPTDQANHG